MHHFRLSDRLPPHVSRGLLAPAKFLIDVMRGAPSYKKKNTYLPHSWGGVPTTHREVPRAHAGKKKSCNLLGSVGVCPTKRTLGIVVIDSS